MITALLILVFLHWTLLILLPDGYWDDILFLVANILFQLVLVVSILFLSMKELNSYTEVQSVCMEKKADMVELRQRNTSHYACVDGNNIVFRMDNNVAN